MGKTIYAFYFQDTFISKEDWPLIEKFILPEFYTHANILIILSISIFERRKAVDLSGQMWTFLAYLFMI